LDGRQDVVENSELKHKIGWGEAWRIAGKIAFEVQFRSALSMSQGAVTQTVEKQIDKARGNARTNKIMVTLFIGMLAAVFGFTVWGTVTGAFGTLVEHRWVTVAFTVSVFCLVGFAFLVFWGIMVSTSFISTNAAAIGQYLPVSQSDTGKLALLSYIRLFDAQMFTVLLAFPIAYGIATQSILGALACFGAFLISVGIAITVMLILALYFYTRIQSAGGSRLSSIVRLLFIFLWVIAILGFSLSFQLIGMIIPLLESLAISLAPIWFILFFGYPFSMGTFVVLATGIPGTPLFWLDFLAVLFYGFLAFWGVRWARRFLVQIGTGGIVQTGPNVIRPATVEVKGLSMALFRKDLRIATRTPGQAIMFFLPIVMMVPIFLQFIWDVGVISLTDVVISIAIPTIMLGFFSIFFLGIEARGMSYTLTLPLKTKNILKSKAQLLAIMSISIPIFVFIISLFKPLNNPVSYLLSISQIGVVYVTAYLSLIIFTRIIGGGRLTGFQIGQHVSQMIFVGFITFFLAVIPIGLFGSTYLFTRILTESIPIASIVGIAGLWSGILITYLLAKLFEVKLLKD
jgi:predicted permease